MTLVTVWTVAHQAPLSMGFQRQEYWSGFDISFSRRSSWPRDQTCIISCIGMWVLYHWVTREAHVIHSSFSVLLVAQYLPPEKAMAPHYGTPAWKIPWTEEPGRLQSMGSLRVGPDWATSLSLSLSCIREGNGNPLQCSCLENPRDGGAWWAAVYGVPQSQTQLKQLRSSSSSSSWLLAVNMKSVCVFFFNVWTCYISFLVLMIFQLTWIFWIYSYVIL